MQWLRNVFARKATQPTKSTRRSFRPNLEALDARDLPSVSSVLTASGLTSFIVDNSNSLLVSTAGGVPIVAIQGTPTSGVRTAQGFRTVGGGLGVDIVNLDGTWQHFEQAGGPTGALFGVTGTPGATISAANLVGTPAGGRILDVGTAYDSAGRARLDILIGITNNSNLDQVGTIFEFTQAGVTGALGVPGTFSAINLLGNNVRWLSDYLTVAGGTGIAFGQVTGGVLGTMGAPPNNTGATFSTGTLFVQKFDATFGAATLYNGLDQGGGGITEYTQTVAPSNGATTIFGNILGIPTTNNNPRVVIDYTFDADTSPAFITAFNPTRTYASRIDTGANGTSGLTVTSITTTTGAFVVKPGG